MFKLLKLAFDKKSWIYFIINTIFSILQTLGYIAIPILLGFLNELGDSNILQNQTIMPWLSKHNQSIILMSIMIGISVFSFIFAIISIYCTSALSTYLANDLRVRVFKKVIDFSKEDWNVWNKPQILNFVTVDLTYISNAIEFLFRIVYKTIFMYVGSIIGILIISFNNSTQFIPNYPNIPIWSMTVMSIVISLVMFIMIILISYYASKHFSKNQESLDAMNEFIESDVNAQKTIKLLNLQEYQIKRFQPLNEKMKKVYIRTGLIQSALLPTIYFFLDVAIVLATWLTPKTMIAQLSSFLLFLGLILSSMVSCSLAIININKGISCSRRICELLNYENKIKYSLVDKVISNSNIHVTDLKYNYEDKFKLSVNSFDILENQKIGIFGLTNSGKSTFINLLLNQLISKNSIFVGNIDISNLSKNNLSTMFSYCPQNPQLFSGTIKSNLQIGNPKASLDEINNVLEKVNLNNFTENNINTDIGEAGKKLSGGQKQRLMIARTMISPAKIHIYDDCFSALDRITQSQIIDRILNDNQTCLITSQKPNLLKNCDVIYVFDKGTVVAKGTHNELMKNCTLYHEAIKEVLLD